MRNTNPNHEIEEPRSEEMSNSYQISVRPRPISPPQERTCCADRMLWNLVRTAILSVTITPYRRHTFVSF